MKAQISAAAVVLLLSAPAAADAFLVGDLGPVQSRRVCMETAGKVLEANIAAHGGTSASTEADGTDGWVTYGWGLHPGTIDAVIICPVVENRVNAFYALHSSGERAVAFADFAAERIRVLWNEMP